MDSFDKKQVDDTYDLEKETELRVEVAPGNSMVAHLKSNTCESFGANLSTDVPYELGPGSYSFFTWTGCTIQLKGDQSLVYQSNDSSFPIYANINAELEKDRVSSRDQCLSEGPNVLVIGPYDVGKTTICKTLLNYALRCGWQPTYVDLDLELNNLAIPGCISATPIELSPPTNDLSGFNITSPQTFFFGHTSHTENRELFTRMTQSLSVIVKSRLQQTSNDKVKYGGVFIDTNASLCHQSTDVINFLIRQFDVRVVLVVDNEHLHATLMRDDDLKDLEIAFARIPRCVGAIPRSHEMREKMMSRIIHNYFYGPKSDFSPTPLTLRKTQFPIYSTKSTSIAPVTSLPVGAMATLSYDLLSVATPESIQPNQILALSYATSNEDAAESTVAGFFQIQTVSERSLLILSPNAQPPRTCDSLLIGTISWFDGS